MPPSCCVKLNFDACSLDSPRQLRIEGRIIDHYGEGFTIEVDMLAVLKGLQLVRALSLSIIWWKVMLQFYFRVSKKRKNVYRSMI